MRKVKLAIRLSALLFVAIACFLGNRARAENPWVVFEGKDGPGKGKHIVFVTGDEEYRSEEGMPQLAKILAMHHGFKCTVLFAINKQSGEIDPVTVDNIPGLEALKTADLMVLFTRFRELPDDQMKQIIDYTNSGKPIVALRTATHPFNYTKRKDSLYAKYSFNRGKDFSGGYGRQILGETWVNHYGVHQKESTRGLVAKGMENHPITKGVEDIWGPSDVYELTKLTGDSKPVIMGQVLKGMNPTDEPNPDKRLEPIAWIKSYTGSEGKTARIFTTTMGHAGDLKSEGFRRLMVNACYWAMGLEDRIPAKANVDLVGKYEPVPIGFGKHKPGVKPSDHKLPADLDASRLALIRPRMQEFVDRGEIAGAVTVVGRRDRVASVEVVGYQDLERKTPMRPDSIFRIASMTKPVTAIGIMILADEGKLSVDDPVAKYLPEFAELKLKSSREKGAGLTKPSRPITLRDLLTHTSGMSSGLPPALADLYVKRDRTLAEAIPQLAREPLEFEPGTKWAYCNLGIDTLGRVIEVVSGQPYETFLKERIFQPLGMTDTSFYPTPEQAARIAVTYGIKDGKLVRSEKDILGSGVGAKYPIPAGGLYSTGNDLAKLYRMMLNCGELDGKRILSPASVAKMTQVHTGQLAAAFTPGMGFGLGWAVVRTPEGVTAMLSKGTYGHGGAFGTQGWIDPNKDLFMVLLIQRVGLPNSDASEMRRQLQAAAVSALQAAEK